jgi:hypothetical protein
MNKYSAELFFKIGCLLGDTHQALYHVERPGGSFPKMTPEAITRWLRQIAENCEKIALTQASKYTTRIIRDMSQDDGLSADELRTKIRDLEELMGSEMDTQLFLWVPPRRAEFYSRRADSLLGSECCARFPSIQREVKEAATCYAVARYTACAFHMARSTEAGMQALARAINFVPHDNNWNLVFRELGNQFKLPSAQRPPHWQTHGDFLDTIWADLRAVSKAWRNDIAHLVDTYSEDDAEEFMAIIPIFLRDLAKTMDENGKLY